MPALGEALIIMLICTAFYIFSIEAAPTHEKAVRRASNTIERDHAQKTDEGRRRSKRQIVFEDAPLDEDDEIRQELSELSDTQLRVLADIVQNEIEKFDEEEPTEYEIIEIPDELITSGRMRRSDPSFETPSLIVVPDEVIEDTLDEQEEDLELRMRIAEIAQILNERANRYRS